MYQIFITLYVFILQLIAYFHPKVKRMVNGQQKTWNILKQKINTEEKYIWIHAASLGEFEQGIPIIEMIKKKKPNDKILLTFFSPSGFEIIKNYPQIVDIMLYLPFDTKKNAKRFTKTIPLSSAIFIKYEFWMNYLSELRIQKIQIYLISAFFQKSQIFFHWYGKKYRKCLEFYTHLFVQDYHSKKLLNQYGIFNVSVCGDTRFDRVYSIYKQVNKIPLVEKFLHGKKYILVAGSTWPEDEKILISYFNKTEQIHLIIVPHEITKKHIQSICSQFKRTFILYSESTEETIKNADCLIIDCFGLLSSLYKYGHIAYIGGGFRSGIHNILEAVVFGIPTMFGPNHQRFKEARDLLIIGGGSVVKNSKELSIKINQWLNYPELRKAIGEKAKQFIIENIGATKMIFEKIFL